MMTGKTLVIGGGSINEEGTTNSPTRSTVVLDTNTGLATDSYQYLRNLAYQCDAFNTMQP